MANILTAHLEDAEETYAEHFVHAGGFGLAMLWAGIACLLHAIFPFLFVKTGSDAIRRLYDRMCANRADLIARKKASDDAFAWVI